MSCNKILNEEFENIILNTSTEEEKDSSIDSKEEKKLNIKLNSNISEINIKEISSSDKEVLKENTKLIPENEITKINDTFIFNAGEYKYYNRYNKYNNIRKIKKIDINI